MPTAVLSACALCCPILPERLPRWDPVQVCQVCQVRLVRQVHRAPQVPNPVNRVAQLLRVLQVLLPSQPMPPSPWWLQPVDKRVPSQLQRLLRPQRLQPKLLRQPQPKPKPQPARLPPPCARLIC